ncbi:uncharacterized protein METZ01_LOCUS328459, partial [marine metagenome]
TVPRPATANGPSARSNDVCRTPWWSRLPVVPPNPAGGPWSDGWRPSAGEVPARPNVAATGV